MSERESMDLLCIKYDGWQPRIRPGTPRRQWMDGTSERYAYRCLPLTIANSQGWELLSPIAFEAKWDGGEAMESVEVRIDSGFAEHLKPVTLFGYGTLTFHVEAIFRTPPGWNLFVSAPPNRQKDGIQALSGIIETDWSPYTFTMNWRFTRPDQWIRFEENEPIAFFFPVERGSVERFQPKLERLEDHGALKAAFEKWSASRNAFQEWVRTAEPDAPGDKWQKLYFRGLDADGKPGPADHQPKIRLAPFAFADGQVMSPPEMRACPMRNRPVPVADAGPGLSASTTVTGGVLLNYQGGKGPAANPALALALGRIDFNAPVQQSFAKPASTARPKDADAELALRQRDWLLETQERQRRLADGFDEIARVRNLAPEAFLREHYAPSRPVIIEQAMTDWPALARWTPDYLAALIGSAEIDVQGERDADPNYALDPAGHRRRMPFDRFIAAIETAPFSNDLAITTDDAEANREALAPLTGDLGTLDPWLMGAAGRAAIGPAGTFTPLHFDLANQFVAQIVGEQRLLLVPPSETHCLYPRAHTHSAVHDLTDETQLSRYPLARGAQFYEVDLAAGALLFVPVGWWWQATATDFSVSLLYSDFHWPNEAATDFPRR